MINMSAFLVSINSSGVKHEALLCPTTSLDIEQIKEQKHQNKWLFEWDYIYRTAKIEKRELCTLKLDTEVLGLVSFAISGNPPLITIENLETNPLAQRKKGQERLAEPVGKWLIWYCLKIGLPICDQRDDIVLTLFATSSSKLYYQKEIGMTYKGSISLDTGEIYVFRFDRQAANKFCNKQEKEYGNPTQIEIE
jgi:hypothetical protein